MIRAAPLVGALVGIETRSYRPRGGRTRAFEPVRPIIHRYTKTPRNVRPTRKRGREHNTSPSLVRRANE